MVDTGIALREAINCPKHDYWNKHTQDYYMFWEHRDAA